MILTDFGDVIAERIRAEHRALATRWFERLLDLLPVDAREIFPTESLLDHVPALILEISAYLRHPEEDAIAANTAILDKARELGSLRHAQRASLHQVLREYQVLSGVLVTFVVEEMARLGIVPPPAETALLVSRLHQAVDVLSQATVETFVTLYTQTIDDQRERLEQFTRMAAHEWRQPLGALQFGISLLGQAHLDPERTRRTLETVERNVRHLIDLTHKLETVARMHNEGDNAVVQEVSSGTVAAEAARQLREMADARGVEIRVLDALPTLTIDVGRLELTFVNLLSNGIKYRTKQSLFDGSRSAGSRAPTAGVRLRCGTTAWGFPRSRSPRSSSDSRAHTRSATTAYTSAAWAWGCRLSKTAWGRCTVGSRLNPPMASERHSW